MARGGQFVQMNTLPQSIPPPATALPDGENAMALTSWLLFARRAETIGSRQ